MTPTSPTLPVAVVTARFPPMDSTGTIRVEALREHLPAMGIHATYVTISPEWMVQQASDLELPIRPEPDAFYATAPWDAVTRLVSRIPVIRRVQRWCLVPDLLIGSSRAVADALASDLPRTEVVYATGPPFSAYRTGRLLAEALNASLIIELRDPPMMDRRAAKRGRVYLRRMKSFERRHVLAAKAIVTLTPGVKSYLLETYPELDAQDVVVIPNGSRLSPSAKRVDGPNVFTLVYAGSLRSRSDVNLLREIAGALGDLEPPGCLRLVGAFSDSVVDDIERAALGRVHATGRVSRDEALREMRSSDASLVIGGDDEWWWIGRKVIESLMHAPRVLAVAPPGDLTDLLGKSAKSVVLLRGHTRTELRDAVRSLSSRDNPTHAGTSSEPKIPTDADVAAAVANLMRAVVDDRSGQDWKW